MHHATLKGEGSYGLEGSLFLHRSVKVTVSACVCVCLVECVYSRNNKI
jgi:hypothetical protein